MGAKKLDVRPPVLTIPIDTIDVDENYIRQNKTDITGLKQTISDVGLLQPILLHRSGERYVIVDGARRFRAMKDLAITDLIVGRDVVVDVEETTADVKFKQIIANIQREDINDVELGHAFVLLKEQYDYDYKEIAEIIGKTPHYVTAKVGLAIRLSPDVQAAYMKDIESEKCNRVTSADNSEGAEDSYLVSVKVVEAIARLPPELQMSSYVVIKNSMMDKKEAMEYLRSVRDNAALINISGNIKEMIESCEFNNDSCDREKILKGCLNRLDRDIEKLLINVKSRDFTDEAAVIPALESLIDKLNSLYSELKSNYSSRDFIETTG